LSSVTVAGFSKTAYTYNAQNRLASVARTNLSSVGTANQTLTTMYTYVLYANGMVKTLTVTTPSPGGADNLVYQYDAYGNLTSVTNGLGHATIYSNYNALGEVGKIVGPNGDETNFVYDARGRVASKTTHPNGAVATWSYGYDGFGLLASITAPDGQITSWTRNSVMRVTKITHNDKDGASTETFGYDANGDVTSDVIARGSVVGKSTTYVYDGLGRVYQVKGSNNQVLTYAYDGNGNTLSVTDVLGHKTRYTYDALNRAASVTDAMNGVTAFAYDKGDNVVKVTDPRGLITSYSYDGLGDLWKQVSPDTGTTTLTYDTYGRLVSRTRADGVVASYAYDALNRPTNVTAGGQSRTYAWDACSNGKGRLCTASTSAASVNYSYTPEGWIAARGFSITSGPVYAFGYGYNALGQVTDIAYPDGNHAYYDYNHGAVSQVRLKVGASNVNGVTGITYRPMDMAMSGWTSYNGLTNTISYDSDLRPTGISTPNVENLAFSYDTADRITKITNGMNGSNTQTLGYDALDRLTSVASGAETASYTYDADGNRTHQVYNGTSTTFTYASTSNRLSGATGGVSASYSYNAYGSTTTVNGLAAYTYDPFGRLSNAGGAGFLLSAEDQRLRKTSVSGTTYFAPDAGGAMLAESLNGTWYDYVWLNGRLVTVIANGGVFPVHADQTGRPLALTHPTTQAILWQAAGLAFDRNVTQNNWGSFNVGFPGQYWDSEDGLWQNGYRDYDATTGRYIESDPIGLTGGVNTYAYVGNNPISWIDSFGLKLCSATLPGLGKTYLDSSFYPLVQNWINANSAAGISVRFTSAFRTTAHQGNMGAGAITPAAPGHSLHEAGFAVDISWSSLSSANQATVLQNAGTSGLSWGGNFTRPDPVHFYNDPGNRTQYIQAAQKDYQNGSASACKCGS
jgi:RHS repeat-associated protein